MNATQVIEHLRSGLTRTDAETFAATIRGALLTDVCKALYVPAGSVRDRQAAVGDGSAPQGARRHPERAVGPHGANRGGST
jgi:hypothetical protein